MSTPTPQHDAWAHSALGVNPADFASPPPAGPNGGGSTQDHTTECDRFLKDHHFYATKSEEIVPGDMQCDLWLDDHLVKREGVQAALVQAIPALQNDPIWVAHYVADHWDQEIKKALLQSGALLLQPAELYDTGYQAGLAGAMQICPAHTDAKGEAAYNQGYADGQKDRPRAALRDRILREVQDGNPKKDDLLADIGELGTRDMKFVLDLMADLKKAGQLDAFSNYVTSDHWRTGVAIATIEPMLDAQWQAGVARLNEDDRAAVLARVPAGSYVPPAKPDGAGSGKAAAGDDSSPLTIGVMFIPKQLHWGVKGTSGQSADPPALQVQGQYAFKFHREGKAGFEWAPIVQGTFIYDDGKKQMIGQPMLGGQGTFEAFLAPIVQLQVFVQVLEGATFEVGKGVGGSISCSAVGTTQAALGVQAVFSLPGSKHLQLVLQSQVSSTGAGHQVTVDAANGIGLQWAF
jgi:hypothetical protein